MLQALNDIQRQTTKSPGNSNHIKSTNIMDDDNNDNTMHKYERQGGFIGVLQSTSNITITFSKI